MESSRTVRSAADLAGAVRSGQQSASATLEAALDRIEARNDDLNAFITVCPERARSAVTDLEDAGEDSASPLQGVPVAVKDLLDVAGVPTTAGSVSVAEADYVPDRSDPVVDRLEAAGAVIVGKTNTAEFGHLAITDNDLVGATPNPFDMGRHACGSSGGSAAAVAAGLVPVALGTDYGGSIRIPASACGVVGFKPTFGTVPRDARPDAFLDTLPFASTGPLARTVTDAALLCDVLAGSDSRDPFSASGPRASYLAAVDRPVDDLQVAYSPDLEAFPVEPAVRSTVGAAVTDLVDAGPDVERVSVDAIGDAWADGAGAAEALIQARLASVAAASSATYGVDLRDHRSELSFVLPAAIETGESLSVLDLHEANVARTALFDAVEAVFAEYDLLVTPTLAVPPFPLETMGPTEVDGESVDPYTGWFLTAPFNLTGHPAASVPAGVTAEGLPVGLQIVGPRHGESTVLAACGALERERPWAYRYDDLDTDTSVA